MLLITSNKSRQLLYIRYAGQVRPEEFLRSREDLVAQLVELSAGFRLLADFSQLESMKLDCEPELGRMMELIGQAGVDLVVRVISRPKQGHRDEHPDGLSLSASSAGGDLSKPDRSRQSPRSLRQRSGILDARRGRHGEGGRHPVAQPRIIKMQMSTMAGGLA